MRGSDNCTVMENDIIHLYKFSLITPPSHPQISLSCLLIVYSLSYFGYLLFLSSGYSIFVVKGDLPDCEADQLLQMIRVQQMQRPKLIGEETLQSRDQR